MHNFGKSCKLIKFSPVDALPVPEAEFLEEIFDVVAINYTDDGKEEYIGYAPLDFKTEAFVALARQKQLQYPLFSEELLESKNWLKENVIRFSPFEIGDFMIYGIHEASCPPTLKIPIQVYAATAFGSEHQTTKMCLSAISELNQRINVPHRILDMGTGSGILSIAAARIWHNIPQIVAADIDEEAVNVTQNNALTNNAETSITVVLSDGYQNPLITATAPYDLIFANILANPLKTMIALAYQHLAADGCYLISGFVDNQEQDIIEQHQQIGFSLLKTYQMENWRAALLQKK